MLIDMSKIKVYTVAELDLEKAAFKHGYYSHLVPKKITGSDGVERIHWVNPDKDKKVKLTRVTHFRDGSEAEHVKEIQKDHIIEPKELTRFSEGDKVVVSYGKEKGQEGVLRGVLAGPSPRVSVAFLNPKTSKHEARTLNVNHIKLVHRANDETKKVIERKTVEVTNIKGETILVDRGDYEKYYKDRERKKTPQERVAEAATRLEVGGTYKNSKGQIFHVQYAKKIGDKIEYTVKIFTPGRAKIKIRQVSESTLATAIKDKGYERVPRVTIVKEAKVFDEDTATWKKYVTDKPLSAELESGDLHKKGHFPYEDGFRSMTPADEELGRKILAEHWTAIERTVTNEIAKYNVSEGEVTGADIIDPLTKAVASYEPLLDKGGGIEGRLRKYAKSFARSEAEKIHEREMSTVRETAPADSDSPTPISPMDKAAVEEALGNLDDIIASAFVSKHDAMVLDEGLKDESDMMSWLYGDEKILDVMKRWTGIGEFESTLNKKEAAEELAGYAYNPATMEPYSKSTIESYLLPKELVRIIDAFKAEGMGYPDFMQTLKTDVNLRNKLKRNRKIAPVHPKDESVIKVVRDMTKKPEGRAGFAAQLIKLGLPPRHVAPVMQLADRILAGVSVPEDYPKQLPREAWRFGPRVLAAWFKEHLPPSVFSGERGAAFGLPRRFDIEKPFKSVPTPKEIKQRRQMEAEREFYQKEEEAKRKK